MRRIVWLFRRLFGWTSHHQRWMTITLEDCETDIILFTENRGVSITHLARLWLHLHRYDTLNLWGREEVEFCRMTVRELTGGDSATIDELKFAVWASGGRLCQRLDVIPLRTQYLNQPKGEVCYIISQPWVSAAEDHHRQNLFSILRSQDNVLRISQAGVETPFPGDNLVIFRK